MFCKSCGAQIPDEARICSNCGIAQGVPQTQGIYDSNQEYQNGMKQAKTSLICGIISIFCFGLVLGIIAIIYGAKGYSTLKRINQPTGTALAGIILGILGFIGWVVVMINYDKFFGQFTTTS